MALGEVNLLVAAYFLSLRQCQYVVELGNELLDGRDELNDTFGDDNRTKVVTVGSTYAYSISNVVNDIVKAHILSLNLLRNEADIGLCLQGTLQGDVRSRAAHHLDEMPVLTC